VHGAGRAAAAAPKLPAAAGNAAAAPAAAVPVVAGAVDGLGGGPESAAGQQTGWGLAGGNAATVAPASVAVAGAAVLAPAAPPAAPASAAAPSGLAGGEMGKMAAGLAAAVTAMTREGKNALSMKLEPPALGTLSIHLAVGDDAKVNVLLVAAVPQTAQAFSAGADDLRQAFVNAGIDLGQLNIGGGKADFSGAGAGSGGRREAPAAFMGEAGGEVAPALASGVRAIA